MVKITIQRESGIIKKLIFEGHAGFDVKGKDIVCSAVSVLFINTMNSIEHFTEDKIKSEQNPSQIIVTLPSSYTDKTSLLLDSMLLGLKEIEREYSEHVSLVDEEV